MNLPKKELLETLLNENLLAAGIDINGKLCFTTCKIVKIEDDSVIIENGGIRIKLEKTNTDFILDTIENRQEIKRYGLKII